VRFVIARSSLSVCGKGKKQQPGHNPLLKEGMPRRSKIVIGMRPANWRGFLTS
jgi:hypothetical protein